MAETKPPSGSGKQEHQDARAHPPAEAQPAQEWGQREDTARTIASGGREPGANPGSEEKKP
ncbi:MAG: hypothetical protein JO112_02650 [Planctomycetes bacterium]|nr:hypothetical protein [Planctomycetota bacterium]